MKGTLIKLLTLLLLLTAIPGRTQHVMFLQNISKGKWFRYTNGDDIILGTKKEGGKLSGNITSISDSFFTVSLNNPVRLDNVSYIERTFKNRKRNGALLAIAGGALVAIVTTNNLLNHQTVIDPVYVAVGAGITVAGLAWMSTSKRKYHVGTKWRLKILDYSGF